MKAINIQWDIDLEEDETYEEVLEEIGLPTEIEIPDDIEDEDEISDYISDITGYCHYGYELIERE